MRDKHKQKYRHTACMWPVHLISAVIVASFCAYWRISSAADKRKKDVKDTPGKVLALPSPFGQDDGASSSGEPASSVPVRCHLQVDCTAGGSNSNKEELVVLDEDAPEAPKGFKEIVCVELACDLNSFFRHVLSGRTNFVVDQHAAIGQHDFVRSPWTRDEDGKSLTRIFHFTTPLTQPMGPKEARCQQTHWCTVFREQALLYRTKQKTLDIPFSNDFTVDTWWLLSPSPNSSPSTPLVQLSISVAVPFTAFNLFKGIIEKTSYAECRSFHSALAEEARSMFVKMSADSSGLRRALTIMEHAATMGVERALTMQKRDDPRTLQRGPSIISGKPPPTSQMHVAPLGDERSWGTGAGAQLLGVLLLAVVMLQLLMLHKMWDLQARVDGGGAGGAGCTCAAPLP